MDQAADCQSAGMLESVDSESSTASYQFPATFAQRRLWFLDQLEPGNISYLIPWSIRIRGALHVAALQQSLNEIVRRHEILRTTFVEVDSEPVQIVSDSLDVSLPVVDLSHLAEDARLAEAHSMAAAEARRPLDLRNGPIIRAKLIRLAGDDHLLLLTLHHIIFDGWSRRIFARELTALYDAFRNGQPSPLDELPLQYADCAVWQHQHFRGKKFEKQLAYWKLKLASAPASLELPTDRPRPPIQTTNGAVKPLVLPGVLVEQLKDLSRSKNATLFMTLLAGFKALLARYSGEYDILVGTPIANRSRAQTEEVIGLFANTLVLRTVLDGDPSFSDLLARTKETALDAYANQDMPFERLVEEVNPERSLAHNPLFQVLFSLQNAPRQAFELTGLVLEGLDATAVTAKFDISMYLTDSDSGIRGRIEYNTDLFDGGTIERLAGHYQTLLEAAATNPELRLSQLPLLTPGERTLMLEEWNATASEYPHLCVHQLFEQQAAQTPERIACRDDHASVNYRDLNERANQLAHFLIERGAGPNKRVGLFVERSLSLMICLLAIQKTGAAYVPMDPAYPADRIGMMIEDADLTVVVTEAELKTSLPETGTLLISWDTDSGEINKRPKNNPVTGVRPDDLIYVIFTSGSTGRPKGVEVRHSSVVNLLLSMGKELSMGQQDVFPALASYAFDMSIPELYLALVTGGCVAIGRTRLAADGVALAEFLRKMGATVVHATPTSWTLLLEAGFAGRGLKRAIGAEALPSELSSRLLRADPSLYNFYGPTETTVWSTLHHFRSADEPVLIGHPLANTQIYILDAHLNPVPAGVVGELYVGGDGVAQGYRNRPELTAERFLDDPFRQGQKFYRTGDRARFLANGNVQFLGRSDHQVKIRGYRIELGEIETALAKHDAVKDCVVVAREDAPGNQRLVAYVVSTPQANVTAAELKTHLKRSVPEYAVPPFFVFLNELPLTPNRKVDRKALPPPDGVVESAHSAIEPRTDLERGVMRIWTGVLCIRGCGVADNFFELGGHSLLLVRLATRLEKEFGQIVPLSLLFQSPTVEKIAEYLSKEGDRENPVFIPFNDKGSGPALFFVHSVTGDVNSYRYLAPLLDQDQRFYGIELPVSFRTPEKAPLVEDLARFYVERLLQFEPHGPYMLGGWSAGTPVALEMAQKLRELGHQVDLLVAIDAAAPNTGGTTPPNSLKFFWKLIKNLPSWFVEDLGVNFTVRRLIQRAHRRIKGFLRKALASRRTASQRAQDRVDAFLGGGEYSQSARAFMGAFFLQIRKYMPKPYEGRVLLFKARTEPLLYLIEADQRWKRLAADLEIVRVSGTHVSIIEELHVAELAAHLNERLQKYRSTRSFH